MNEAKKLLQDLKADCSFHMPQEYGTGGSPLFWMNEASGVLREAITLFLGDEKPLLDPETFRLLKEYIAHWVYAPGWHWYPEWPSRPALREKLERARNREDLWDVLHELLDIGIDPL